MIRPLFLFQRLVTVKVGWVMLETIMADSESPIKVKGENSYCRSALRAVRWRSPKIVSAATATARFHASPSAYDFNAWPGCKENGHKPLRDDDDLFFKEHLSPVFIDGSGYAARTNPAPATACG
jgi:hypothetical protein